MMLAGKTGSGVLARTPIGLAVLIWLVQPVAVASYDKSQVAAPSSPASSSFEPADSTILERTPSGGRDARVPNQQPPPQSFGSPGSEQPAQDADRIYCAERQLGYWFYCSRPKADRTVQRAAMPARPEPLSAAARLDAITTELRELKARAILEPSPANVAAYIRFQRAQLERASLFSDVWQRAIWQDPDLDYTLQRPLGALAKQHWQDVRANERDQVMARLSQRYGLFYFFARSCSPCAVMSPIVKAVAQKWQLTVRAISTDGGASPHFPDYRVDTGQRARLGLASQATPAVVLWDSVNQRPIPIGFGILSADELQDRIYLLTAKEAGHDF